MFVSWPLSQGKQVGLILVDDHSGTMTTLQVGSEGGYVAPVTRRSDMLRIVQSYFVN